MLIIAIIVLCVANHLWTSKTAALVSSGFAKPNADALLDEDFLVLGKHRRKHL
jgi:hypothetical protein